MDWHEIAAVLSGVFTFASVFPYVRDMLKGATRPNIVTWGLWFLIQLIFTVAQFAAGASWSVVLPLVEVFTVGLVFVLAIFGYGYKQYGWLDVVCFVLALVAIVLWQLTSEPVIALVLSAVTDLIAAVPTLIKAYKDPISETPLAYFLVVISSVLAGFSTTIVDLPNLLIPFYIASLNLVIVLLIFFGKRTKNALPAS